MESLKQKRASVFLSGIAWFLSTVVFPVLFMLTMQMGIIGMLVGNALFRGLLPFGMSFWLASVIARKRGLNRLSITFVGLFIALMVVHAMIFRAALRVAWVL